MKNLTLKLFLIIGAISIIAACTKDDEKKAASLIGSWFLTQESEKYYTNDTLRTPPSRDTTFTNNDEEVLTVTEDKIFVKSKEIYNDSVYFTYDTATYKTSGNNLIIYSERNDNGQTYRDTANLTYTLSDTEFSFTYKEEETEDGVKFKYEGTRKYKKK